jgi:hypothetical protein
VLPPCLLNRIAAEIPAAKILEKAASFVIEIGIGLTDNLGENQESRHEQGETDFECTFHSPKLYATGEKSPLQCAGLNRHEAEEEEASRERTSDPLGPEFCGGHREVHDEA